MTKNRRNLLFYLLVVIFFTAGTAIVFYAQGWRFNTETLRISKVGGIFVRSFPDNALIFLDKKPVKNDSTFLGRGTLISDLFPKTYQLELEEPGYDAWHESASVSPSLVAEFKSAVLVPHNATTVAPGPVQNFSFANGILIAQNASGTIASGGAPIGKGTLVDEDKNGSAAIIKNNASGRYFLYQFGNNTTTDLTAILVKSGARQNDISNIFFDPQNPGTIIAQEPSKIWTMNTTSAQATPIKKASVGETIGGSVAVGSSFIAWTDSKNPASSSSITIYDALAGTIAASSTVPGKNNELTWIKDDTLGILQTDGELYLYDTGMHSITHVADDVRYFSATKDGSSIAALENGSLEIVPLTGNSYDYYRFNLPNIMDARRVIWYKDDAHLFIEYSNHVSFLDLTDASLNNFTTIALGVSPVYDADQNALYIIDPDQNLIRFDFPE